jgi:hypothetical protein
MRRFPAFIAAVILLTASACGSTNNVQPQLPYTPVNVALQLTSQQYAALRTVNGAVVLPSGSSGLTDGGGIKGIIVVRQADNSYRAFERNCPYRPYDACALVSLDRSGLFMSDTCCGSQFNLQGQATGGPSGLPLLQYSTSLQGTQLNILN